MDSPHRSIAWPQVFICQWEKPAWSREVTKKTTFHHKSQMLKPHSYLQTMALWEIFIKNSARNQINPPHQLPKLPASLRIVLFSWLMMKNLRRHSKSTWSMGPRHRVVGSSLRCRTPWMGGRIYWTTWFLSKKTSMRCQIWWILRLLKVRGQSSWINPRVMNQFPVLTMRISCLSSSLRHKWVIIIRLHRIRKLQGSGGKALW